MNRRFRWVTEGETYIYSAALGKGCDERRGQECVALTVPRSGNRPSNVEVQFPDGVHHVVPLGVLKKVPA